MNAWEQYAFDIENGKIPACKRVKQAVKRYFNDLNNPLYVFDSEVVARFISFSRVCPHVKGHLRGKSKNEIDDESLWIKANPNLDVYALVPWLNRLRYSLTVESYVTTAIRCSRGQCPMW